MPCNNEKWKSNGTNNKLKLKLKLRRIDEALKPLCQSSKCNRDQGFELSRENRYALTRDMVHPSSREKYIPAVTVSTACDRRDIDSASVQCIL